MVVSMGALHDLFIAAERADNGTTVSYAADGRGSQTQEGKLNNIRTRRMESWPWTRCDGAERPDEFPRLVPRSRVRVRQESSGLTGTITSNRKGLMTLTHYFDHVRCANRFSLYVKWLFTKMSLKDMNPTPILYSVVADVATKTAHVARSGLEQIGCY